MNALIKIKTNLSNFTPSEKILAEYILENKEKVIHMSLSELASETELSEATAIRFARKLGYNGFPDFKIKLSSSLAFQTDYMSIKDVYRNDRAGNILRKIISSTCKSLELTNEVIDPLELEKAINYIHHAHVDKNRIFITGLGGSSVVASDLQIKLMRLGIVSNFFPDSHLSFENISSITKDDLLIVISTLGHSTHILNVLEIANKNEATIISITQSGNMAIEKNSTIVLSTANVETNLRLTSQPTRIAQLIIVDTIFTALALKTKDIVHEVDKTKALFTEYNYYNDK